MDAITSTVGQRPGKVIAVHLSYRSRAEQRGRIPAHASYFLKTSSSLCGPGEVVRPEGTELLGFEGEVAAVIGTTAKDVTPEDGWAHVGWITASNDLGLHDLRKAAEQRFLQAADALGIRRVRGHEQVDGAAQAECGLTQLRG